MDLETLLCSRDGFGLESATLLQRAKCRIIDGADLADLLARASDHERRCVETAIGCDPALLPVGASPEEVHDLAPIRTGKTLQAAALAFARSQTIDVSIVKPGEEGPRIAILATETDNAQALRGHLNILNERPELRRFVTGETADSVFLRHPSGVVIEVAVIAAKRGGYSLASRWLGSAIFDEAPGWYSTGNIVNLEESRDQALGRLLPGAQLIYAGSKWQPDGHCYAAHRDHFGRPSADIVVISPQEVDGVSPARQLNPVYWTPEQEAKTARKSKRAYAMSVLNNFGGAESALLSLDELAPCIQPTIEGYTWHQAFCGIDPSKMRRRDGFGYVIGFFAHPDGQARQKWVMVNGHPAYPELDRWGRPVCQEMPTKPLLRIAEIGEWNGNASMVDVVKRISHRMDAWGATLVLADDFESASLAGHFQNGNKTLRAYPWSEKSKDQAIGGTLKRYVREQTLSLIPHAEMERELLTLRQIPVAGGARWSYPTHGLDHCSALIALLHGVNDPELLGIRDKRATLKGAPHKGRGSSRHEVPRR
jgi:hypothetical protein